LAIKDVLERHRDHPEAAVDWAERIVDRTINKAVGILTFNAFLLVIAVLIVTDGWSLGSIISLISLCLLGYSCYVQFQLLAVTWGDEKDPRVFETPERHFRKGNGHRAEERAIGWDIPRGGGVGRNNARRFIDSLVRCKAPVGPVTHCEGLVDVKRSRPKPPHPMPMAEGDLTWLSKRALSATTHTLKASSTSGTRYFVSPPPSWARS
jgi:hypothetical protein